MLKERTSVRPYVDWGAGVAEKETKIEEQDRKSKSIVLLTSRAVENIEYLCLNVILNIRILTFNILEFRDVSVVTEVSVVTDSPAAELLLGCAREGNTGPRL